MATKTNMEVKGNKYFRITTDIGIDANGKRIRKQFTGKTKKKLKPKEMPISKKLKQDSLTIKKISRQNYEKHGFMKS